MSHDTVRKVEQIIAKATPEVAAQLRSGELSINRTATTVAPAKLVEQTRPAESWQAPTPTKPARDEHMAGSDADTLRTGAPASVRDVGAAGRAAPSLRAALCRSPSSTSTV